MHIDGFSWQPDRVLLCGLGVSRMNHIGRVHGHTILKKRAPEIFDEVGQRSLERLFPGFTEDSLTQATLSAGPSGIMHKRLRDSTLGSPHSSQAARPSNDP